MLHAWMDGWKLLPRPFWMSSFSLLVWVKVCSLTQNEPWEISLVSMVYFFHYYHTREKLKLCWYFAVKIGSIYCIRVCLWQNTKVVFETCSNIIPLMLNTIFVQLVTFLETLTLLFSMKLIFEICLFRCTTFYAQNKHLTIFILTHFNLSWRYLFL